MSDLPAGWTWVTLNDLQADEPRAITDGPFGSNLTSAHYSDSGARVIRLQNIGDGQFLDAEAYVPMSHFETLKSHEARPGDLIIASLGEVLPKACIVPANLGAAIVKADCIRVRLGRRVDPRWALYAMQTPSVRRWAGEQLHGVGRPRLGLKVIRELPIPLPPIEEQRRIVDILEDHLSRLDAANALLARAQAESVTLYRTALQAEFGRQDQSNLRNLTDVATIVNGHTPKGVAEKASAFPFHDSIPFFKVGDMNNTVGASLVTARSYIHRSESARLGLRLAPAGTVVFPKRGGAIATNKKRVLGVSGAFDLNTMGVTPSESISSEYLFVWFEQVDLASLSDGSNVPQINTPDIARLQLPVPTFEDQARIVRDLAILRDGIDKLPLDETRLRSASLRRALLEAAFSGRLSSGLPAVVQTEEKASV